MAKEISEADQARTYINWLIKHATYLEYKSEKQDVKGFYTKALPLHIWLYAHFPDKPSMPQMWQELQKRITYIEHDDDQNRLAYWPHRTFMTWHDPTLIGMTLSEYIQYRINSTKGE